MHRVRAGIGRTRVGSARAAMRLRAHGTDVDFVAAGWSTGSVHSGQKRMAVAAVLQHAQTQIK